MTKSASEKELIKKYNLQLDPQKVADQNEMMDLLSELGYAQYNRNNQIKKINEFHQYIEDCLTSAVLPGRPLSDMPHNPNRNIDQIFDAYERVSRINLEYYDILIKGYAQICVQQIYLEHCLKKLKYAERSLIEALCIENEKFEIVSDRFHLPKSSLYYKRHILLEKLVKIYNEENLDEVIGS